MPDKNPFSPNPTLAFLTGLTGSTMNTFKEQHDQQQKEDQRRKEIDYEILMAGLEKMQPNLTPSQAKEILTRATDIFKPKGHGGIKDRLHEMFGQGEPYNPQAGTILSEAAAKPRLQVTPAVSGGTGDSVIGNVTLPPPPNMPATFEKTYREQELADTETKVGFQIDKALAVEEARAANRKAEIKARNDAIFDRHVKESGMKNEAKAVEKLKQRAAIFGDPNDPDNLERARVSLQAEIADKREASKARIEYNKKRLDQIDQGLKLSQQRLQATVSKQQQVKFKDDPQWKGMWSKAGQDASAAKLARTQAAIMYSKYQAEGDDDYLEQAKNLETSAETLETDMQKQLDGMENREYVMSGGTKMGGVTLPGNPAGARRGGVMLTEAEIRAKGGGDADVEEARIKGVLAKPKG